MLTFTSKQCSAEATRQTLCILSATLKAGHTSAQFDSKGSHAASGHVIKTFRFHPQCAVERSISEILHGVLHKDITQ